MLYASTLTMTDADLLAERLRLGDRLEADALGMTPRMALGYAAFSVPMLPTSECASKAVRSGFREERSGLPYLVGAFGFTGDKVWSLWAPLTMQEGKALMLQTKEWVQWMNAQTRNGVVLNNIVMATNMPAIKWLEHSGCFDIDRHHTEVHGGQAFFQFAMKTNKELAA